MTMPGKPYIYRHLGLWRVQWYVHRQRRIVSTGTFGDACRLAAVVRRYQMERES